MFVLMYNDRILLKDCWFSGINDFIIFKKYFKLIYLQHLLKIHRDCGMYETLLMLLKIEYYVQS